MKQIYLAIGIVMLSTSLWGQSAAEKKAQHLFEDRDYYKAAAAYQKLSESQENLQNLADSYYFMFNYTKATAAYEKLVSKFDKATIDKSYFFRYAQALKALGETNIADEIMANYSGKFYSTQALQDSLTNVVPFEYTTTVVKGSLPGDFGVSYLGDQLVFATTRNKKSPVYDWNKKAYLDLYTGVINPAGTLVNVKPFPGEVNTKTHESNATFTKDGKTMYFNRTHKNRVKIDGIKVATVGLFKAELINGEWKNITELPFSSDQFNTEHPALSADDSKLYFASDRPETYGSFDIFYVDINADGSFGTPKNMGTAINTPQREQFPFVSNEGRLYFASDGLPGLGGLDIFLANWWEEDMSHPVNLGPTINSNLDDFAYAVNSDSDTGFISSNRDGEDKLYTFNRVDNMNRYAVEGDVVDVNSKEYLPGTIVYLFDENDNLVDQVTVGEDGHYKFKTKSFTKYRIRAEKDLYIPFEHEFTTGDKGIFYFEIEMELESFDDAEEIIVKKDDGFLYVELENIYYDLDKWDIKPQAAKTLDVLVELMKKYPTMEIEIGAHTDSQGNDAYNLKLSSNRAASAVDYLVSKGIARARLTSKGYGETKPLVDCKNDCTPAEYAINRRCEFIIKK